MSDATPQGALTEALDAATLVKEAAMRSDFAPYIEDDGTAVAAAALAVLESNGWRLVRIGGDEE